MTAPRPREEHPVDVVVHHPRVRDLGETRTEQRRVARFARDLARWLHGAPREALGPLARVVTVVARRELRDPRRLCRGRPLLAVESAARATERLWPLLRWDMPDEEPEPPPPPPGGEQGGAGQGDEGDDEGDEGAPLPAGGAGSRGEDTGSEDQGDQQADQAPARPEEGDDEAGAGAGDDEGGDEDDSDETGDDEDEGGDEGEGADDDEGAAPEPDVEDLLREMAGDELDPELAGLADRLAEAFGDQPPDAMDLGAELGDALAPAAEAALDGALESDRVARQLEQFLPGVGWSIAPGSMHGALLEHLDGLSDLIGHLDELEELADALGRLEEPDDDDALEQGGSEEVVGVRLGGEVARALPSELGLLGDAATEDLFYQRMVEHRLVSLELTGAGIDGVGGGEERGPIIACIDTSGSMEGPPALASKALVLALCRRVLPQGRVVHLLLFSGPQDHVELRLKKGRGGLEGLLDFLGLTFRGGTDFDAPLRRAMELLEERELRRADVLVVTDGLARAGGDVLRAVERVKEERGVRVWSVVLGDNDPFGVRPFSDHVWTFDPEGAMRAAGLLDGLQG